MLDFPDLSRLVRPRNVLVVGGSQRANSEGARLLENLTVHSRLRGEVFVVNPNMRDGNGYRCWPSITAVPPAEIDVALIMVRVGLVLDALRDCAARQIPFAIVMSSGFSEAGAEGEAIEAEIRALCARTGLRVYGPNCPGLTNLADRIGMTFSPAFQADIQTGPIGIVTQGGGSGRNLLQGLAHGTGAALWLSGGNELDLGAPDFIAHMAMDPQIRVITVLLEGVKQGARLIAALNLARRQGKPVVVLKVGRSEYGIRAAQSHTGSIAGAAAVNSAVFRQCGAIEVDELDDLVAVSRLLASAQPPASRRLAILTFSGGAAAMAADQAGLHGLQLSAFQPSTLDALRERLPAFAAVSNPVDVTAEALKQSDALAACLRFVAADPDVGAVLVPIPADYGSVTDNIAHAIIEASADAPRPIVPVWMSRRQGSGFRMLEEAGLAPFPSLSKALAALKAAAPPAPGHAATSGTDATHTPPPSASPAGQPVPCNEAAAKHLLEQSGIPVPRGVLVSRAEDVPSVARDVGFPLVMKVASAQILHKTEVNGVHLGIRSPEAAAAAYAQILADVGARRPDARIDGVLMEKMYDARGREMLVGVHTDPAFGRVITVGLGGIFVELLKDVSHRVLPICRDDAVAMLGELRYGACLGAFRDAPPADVDALADFLVKVSAFIMARPEISEAEFNPVWVGPAGEGAVALDALILTAPGNG